MAQQLMPSANRSEIEFALDGIRITAADLRYSRAGSIKRHAAEHAHVDWLMIKHFGRHAIPCSVTCDPEMVRRLTR